MEKKIIRLTESDLHRIVKESVNNILNEFFFFKTDPSEADNEEEYNDITKWRRGLQKKEGEKAQDEHPFAKDTRKASDYWTKKEKGQYTSPKQIRKKTKKDLMMKKKIKDGDILKAMAMHLDEDSVVFGANGHYAVGGYYDITKVSSVFGDKDYNSQEAIDGADSTEAAEKYRTDNDEMNESLQKAEWLKNW